MWFFSHFYIKRTKTCFFSNLCQTWQIWLNLVKTCGANLFQLVPSAELSIIIVDNLKQVRIVIIIIITSIIVTVIIIIITTSIMMKTTRYLSEVFMTDNGDNGGTTVACPDGIICNGVISITITITTPTPSSSPSPSPPMPSPSPPSPLLQLSI